MLAAAVLITATSALSSHVLTEISGVPTLRERLASTSGAQQPEPRVSGQDPAETAGEPVWVGGRAGIEIASREVGGKVLYRSGEVLTDEALPEGYPRPTAPGVLEIKRYPSVRRAEVSGTGNQGRGSRQGFFPLFRHIQRNNIAMTAPVEMDYAPEGDDPTGDFWTMSFLYREADLGPTGEDRDGVRIVDTEPVTVLSIGVMGGPGERELSELHDTLSAWLADNPEWVETDRRRWLGYNGPNVRWNKRWYEVQVIIEPADSSPESDVRVYEPWGEL